MKKVDLLKKIVPLLRENEEVVCIPEKDKKSLFSFVLFFIFIVLIWVVLFVIGIYFLPSSEIMIPYSASAIFFVMFCLVVISTFNKFLVITNQRLICLSLFKTICIERDNIEDVTLDFMQNGLSRKITTVIETKDSKVYKVQFYDYKQIKEQLGL